jgi:hypothetical protein
MSTLLAAQRSGHSAQRRTSHGQVFISLPKQFLEEPIRLEFSGEADDGDGSA